jgi:DNA polymerase-1
LLSTQLVPEPEMVEGPAQARALLEQIQNVMLMAVDTETTGVTRHKDQVVFWSMSDGTRRWCLDRFALPTFKAFLEDPERKLIAHNANFDAWMLLNSGIDLSRSGRKGYRRFDTMVMHTLLADNQPHDLKSLSKDRSNLGINMPSFKETFGSAEKDVGEKLLECYHESDPQKVIEYASLDAWATYHLFEIFSDRLMSLDAGNNRSLWDYYLEIEMPMHNVLWHMERRGSLIDQEHLRLQIPVIEEEMQSISGKVAHTAGQVINLNSPQQLASLFYNKVDGHWVDFNGNAPMKFTAGGESGVRKPSVDVEVLAQRAKSGCAISEDVLRYRRLSKILGTYLKGTLKRLGSDGRLRTSFNQHVTATGRLSSSDPNLQNWPRPDSDEFGIRNAVVAPEGYTLACSDYGQLEMRIAASLSGEESMITSINNGRDMHCWTAHTTFGVPYADVKAAYDAKEAGAKLTPDQKALCDLRSKSKTVGFGTLYGEGPWKLAQQLEISTTEAKEILAKYFAGYPRIREFFNNIEVFGRENRYVTTPLGRRRQMHQLRSTVRSVYREGVRAAGNFPIQGHAAEITKGAQIRIFEDDDIWDSGVRMTLQVHDEVVAEIPKNLQGDDDFEYRWKYYMAKPFGDDVEVLRVPLTADIGYGTNWAEAK